MNALVGKYVNLMYTLPNGEKVKFLDDQKTYLGNQLECVFGGSRRFGIVVNMDFITDVKDDFILSNGEIIPIRVRGRKEMADTYYSYFKNHFDDEEE